MGKDLINMTKNEKGASDDPLDNFKIASETLIPVASGLDSENDD